MKTFPLVIAFSIAMLSACEKDPKKEKEIKVVSETKSAAEILTALENAYDNHSDTALQNILQDWSIENHAREVSSITNGTEKAIYEIYLEFYNPFNIERYGEHEWGNTMYEGYGYVIIQNSVFYLIADGEPDFEDRDTISDFMPPVTLDGKTIVYLSPNYREALDYFLNPDYDPAEEVMFESVSEEGWDHYEFLVSALPILPGHWGAYWHYETHPYINYLVFDTSLTKAKIYFRIGYMFGEAEFEKNSSGWEMIQSDITGIEK
jgi:hypothetical protein